MICRISREVLARCAAEALGSRDEICGLLVGRAGYISGAVPIPNAADDASRSFALEAAAHLRAMRWARREGLRVVGHYHSHPSGDPRPSVADAAQAFDQGVYWLIITPRTRKLWISCRDGSVEGAFDPVALIDERTALQPRGARANRDVGTIEAGQPSA